MSFLSIIIHVWYKKIQKSIFLISNIIVLFFELGDIVYYPYAYRRMLGNDFEMGKDVQNLVAAIPNTKSTLIIENSIK
jgi:hypothetical protein